MGDERVGDYIILFTSEWIGSIYQRINSVILCKSINIFLLGFNATQLGNGLRVEVFELSNIVTLFPFLQIPEFWAMNLYGRIWNNVLTIYNAYWWFMYPGDINDYDSSVLLYKELYEVW